MNTTFQQLKTILQSAGFSCRGKAFFRVCGDSVLQVLKYSIKETPFHSEILKVGLFSMFSELEPQWLTSSGCIPLYNYRYLTAPRWELERPFKEAKQKTLELSEDVLVFHFHLDDIINYTLPFLDGISSQKTLIDGINYMECRSYLQEPRSLEDGLRWTDINKYSPYLYERDYDKAERIVMTLLNLYGINELENVLTEIDPRAERLRQKALLAKNRNADEIRAYLLANYKRNQVLTSFCKK